MFLLALAISININTATLQQLDQLTGIGPKYAQAIIDARPYSSVDDLLKVKGIGPATLQKIKEQGLACVNCKQEEVRPPENLHADSGEVGPPKTYPSEIFINEILPSPKGADETDEFIKLFNSNNFDVDLTGWQLQDTAGTQTTYTVPKDTKILANNFLVFKRPETKIMLNNEGDGLNLLTPDKKIVDSVNFTKAPLGQTYKKTGPAFAKASAGTWQWISNGLPKAQISAKNKPVAPELAAADLSQVIDLGQTANPAKLSDDSRGASPWFLFLIALAATLISAAAVLFIKLKFKNYERT